MALRTSNLVIAALVIATPVLTFNGVLADSEDHSLDYYTDSLFLPRVDLESDDDVAWCTPDSGSISIDTIGLFHDYLVIDLTYFCEDSEWCDEGRAILLESGSNQFRLLYKYMNDCTEVILKPSEVIVVDSAEVLFTRSLITGTGGLVEEKYWVWNDSIDGPTGLDYERETSDTLRKVLPEDCRLAWGGFFDIRTLSLECPVRRPSDYNCCPTGGWVVLRYEIKGSELRIISCSYDPDRKDR